MANALVPTASAARQHPLPQAPVRASAGFVAQLIATAARLPQTRARRRAEPERAISAYRALGHWPIELGRTVSRSF